MRTPNPRSRRARCRRRHLHRIVPALLVTALACGGGASAPDLPVPPAEGFPPPRLTAPERIVLVTIDTLRADHVGAYGYPVDTTPFLDRLASEGVRFDRAFAQSGTTQPSHASLFTGLYPLQHNVLRNQHSLARGYVTLAEVLREAGYTSAGFASTNAHFSWGGLTQGFDFYDELEEQDTGAPELYRQAHRTIDRALQWLETVDEALPFFLWVHLFDPHRPFRPPREHRLRIRLAQRDASPVDIWEFLTAEQRIDFARDRRMRQLVTAYDAEISFVDAEVERLFRALEERGLNDAALWVVTADHGQGLFSHGYFGHAKQIYNETLRVPLIFWARDLPDPGRVVDEVVEHVDVTPTLAAITGSQGTLSEQPGEVQGWSLWPLIVGDGTGYEKRHAYGQRSAYPTRREQRDEDLTAGDNYSLQDRDFKLLVYTEAEDELFDLASDPYETDNIVDERPDVADALRERLQLLLARLAISDAPIEVDDRALERLRALGYVQ